MSWRHGLYECHTYFRTLGLHQSSCFEETVSLLGSTCHPALTRFCPQKWVSVHAPRSWVMLLVASWHPPAHCAYAHVTTQVHSRWMAHNLQHYPRICASHGECTARKMAAQSGGGPEQKIRFFCNDTIPFLRKCQLLFPYPPINWTWISYLKSLLWVLGLARFELKPSPPAPPFCCGHARVPPFKWDKAL